LPYFPLFLKTRCPVPISKPNGPAKQNGAKRTNAAASIPRFIFPISFPWLRLHLRPAGYPVTGGYSMKTREETIIELTRALKALGYDISKIKIDHCGPIDDPEHIEVALKITRQK
jgi:hypothetical protein